MHTYEANSVFSFFVNPGLSSCLQFIKILLQRSRSSQPGVLVEKGVRKICSKFTIEHPCRSEILIKLLCNFIEITLRHGCSSVNLRHIFRTPFLKNTSGWLLLKKSVYLKSVSVFFYFTQANYWQKFMHTIWS